MKFNKISLSVSAALLAAGLAISGSANAKGRLVVYCSATNILCETTTKAFGEKYDVKTSLFVMVQAVLLLKLKLKKITLKRMFGLVVPLTLKHKRLN